MPVNRSLWVNRFRRALLVFPKSDQERQFYIWRLRRAAKSVRLMSGTIAVGIFTTGVVVELLAPGDVNVVSVVRALIASLLCSVMVWVFRNPEKGAQRPGDIRMLLCIVIMGNVIFSRILQIKDGIDIIKEGISSCVTDNVCEALQPLVDDGFVASPSIEALLKESIHARFSSFIFISVVPLFLVAMFVGLAFWEFLVVEFLWYIAVRVGTSMIDFDSGPGYDVFQQQVISLHMVMMTFVVLVYKQEVMLRSEFRYSQHLEGRNKILENELLVAKNKVHQNVDPTEVELKAVASVFSLQKYPKLKKLEIKFAVMELQERIGHGSMGEIIRARYSNESTGETISVALKRIRRGDVKVKSLNKFVSEMLMMAKLKHPNIVAFYGGCWDNPANVCLVMELMARGSLNDVLADDSLTEVTWPNLKMKFAIEVVQGMNYLHTRRSPILHRDLKGDNVLVSDYFVSKLTDFGLSRSKADLTMTQGTGTPLWTAPEVLAGGYYNEACDVYSFAILMVELATQELPFLSDLKADPSLENRLLHMIRNEGVRPRLPSNLPHGLSRLIELCWRHEPSERPRFDAVLRQLEEITVKKSEESGAIPSPSSSSVSRKTGVSSERSSLPGRGESPTVTVGRRAGGGYPVVPVSGDGSVVSPEEGGEGKSRERRSTEDDTSSPPKSHRRAKSYMEPKSPKQQGSEGVRGDALVEQRNGPAAVLRVAAGVGSGGTAHPIDDDGGVLSINSVGDSNDDGNKKFVANPPATTDEYNEHGVLNQSVSRAPAHVLKF